MYILNVSLLSLILPNLVTVSGIPNGRSFNPPPPSSVSKRDATSPLGGKRIQIRLEKRDSEALSPNGVANVTLYKQQILKTLGKINSGLTLFEQNTGQTLKEALALVFQPGESVIGTVVSGLGTLDLPVVNSILKRSSSGSDPLTDDANVLWQGTIQVGTPPTSFTVDFDTGSSDLFLAGPQCTTGCEGHKIFNTSTSSTAVPLNKKFTLAYGDGSSVAGQQFNDTVSIAGITATSQTVGVASVYSGFSTDAFPPDGLLGMGFRAISTYPADPLFQNLVERNLVDSPEFSFKFSNSPGESELTVGGRNEALFDSATLAFVNVTVAGYWHVAIEGVSVNGRSAATIFPGIIDTGTTLIIGDAATVNKTYALIPGARDASTTIGAGFFTYPCNTTSVVSLTFGGRAFNISQDTFNLGQVSASDSENCVGGLVSGNTGVGWIVGDVFLRNTYTIFDFGQRKVGFANLS